MTMESGETAEASIAPDEAFSVLGNEIRMNILQILGRAEDRLSFSELKSRSTVDDPGQFNYHLDKLVGHFVDHSEEGYTLSRPGRRIIQAVLSGSVTDAPILERTEIDWECHFCGSKPVLMEYREEQLGVYCQDCEGLYGGVADDAVDVLPEERQRLHYSHLPPAGVPGRDPKEILLTAALWTNSEIFLTAASVCPRCSAQLSSNLDICDEHHDDATICPACDRRYAALYRAHCTNCLFESAVILGVTLMADSRLRKFLLDHDIDPIYPSSVKYTKTINGYEETIHSTDPVKISIKFTIDHDWIRLTVDDTLAVVKCEKSSADSDSR